MRMRLVVASVLAAAVYGESVPDAESLAIAASRRTMAFVYLWYGGAPNYTHWNHEVLPHWTESENRKYAAAIGKRFTPPHEIHAPFWPRRGLYASADPTVMTGQMRDMASAGIGVAVVSWWGRPDVPKTHDTQGVSTDALIAPLLDAAEAEGVRVAFHLEPYEGRSAASVADDVAYLSERYGAHPAVMRTTREALSTATYSGSIEVAEGGKLLCFVYDSYHISSGEWSAAIESGGIGSRAVLVGLVLDHKNVRELAAAGFDAAYTYFATIGFSFGSTVSNWPRLQAELASSGMGFVPCVAPGYDDRRVRPWNSRNYRERAGGGYYKTMWEAALGVAGSGEHANVQAVAVTSYNEWGEGTQIEAAVPHTVPGDAGIGPLVREALGPAGERASSDYGSGGPTLYLGLTRVYAQRLLGAIARRQEDEL